MDAPLPTDALIRPWRRATIAASLLAAVELVALLLCAFLLLAKPLSHAIEHRATASANSTPAVKKTATKSTAVTHHELVKAPAVGAAKLTRKQTTVLVLNGNGRAGVAHVAATQLQHLGYTVRGAANAPRSDYATTVVMFRPGYAPEGHRLARDIHASVVGPLDGIAASALHGAKLVVILGA